MAANSQCFVEWKEHYVSKEKGKRVVHYFLKDVSGESVLAVVGTERSIRHMLYVVAEDFLKVNEADKSVNAGYRWRSRREVVNWLTSRLSKQHRQESFKSDHMSGFGVSYQNRFARNLTSQAQDIVWSGVAWTCGKQLKHFPSFSRNGITIAVQSFVYVMSEEGTRHLAYLEDMHEDRKGQKKVKVRWFHDIQEIQAAVTLKNPNPKEVFLTPTTQAISVECVDGPALVLAREHYEKCVFMLPEDLMARVHLCVRQFKNNRLKPFKLSKLSGYFDQPIFLVFENDFVEDEDIVKVGGKRARSSRVRQVLPYDASSMDAKYEVLRRKLIPRYVRSRGLHVIPFKVNEKIELLSLDSGIRGCWFRCTIMRVTSKQLKVQYDDLKDEDDGGNLTEWVPAFRMAMPDKLGIRCPVRSTVRPARMEDESNFSIEIGSPVDGWWSDGWWEGVVTAIGESGPGEVKLYIPGEKMFIDVDMNNIRVSRDWVEDNWVELETKRDVLSLIQANNNEIKPESSPLSSKDNPEPVDLERVEPAPVDPEHVHPKPVESVPVGPEPVHPEPIDHPVPVGPEHVHLEPVEPEPKFHEKENKPEPVELEPIDPEPKFHEKENEPISGPEDNGLQKVEQGGQTSENEESVIYRKTEWWFVYRSDKK
ncbi:uncharacterized protein LOC143548147 isoform X2 [Bidens hawaiensis]|uniref:uncharacterized protein LOC143548147 isoform X2 n=1 Tax=Bidens hawaiensis TaxID=980011 RepID=UPI00404A04CC